MSPPAIPDHLLWFEADQWSATPGAHYPELTKRERWRRAQDRWAEARGLDWAAFERLADHQRAVARLADQ